ncbi:MAG: dihydrodipicolinate synthase family protein [Candidatus Latescibacteria bacterium]|nr:dihydrodipicolinate synthase family protein [Candidatus Latescibacterota bacterium]
MKPVDMAHGIVPPMLTPFNEDRSIDFDGIAAFTDWMIGKGAHVLFPVCGTGEMFSLSMDEACQVAEAYHAAAAGRVPVIATGTLAKEDPEACIEGAKIMSKTGIDSVVVLSPDHLEGADDDAYFEYYKAINDAVDIPLWVYELPGRPKIGPSLFGRLAKLDKYVGSKDTTLDLDIVKGKIAAADGQFNVLQAGEHIFWESLALGCTGACSIGCNVFPSVFVACYDAYQDGDTKRGELAQEWIIKLLQIMKPHPEVAKLYLGRLSLPVKEYLRKPATPLNTEQQGHLDSLPDMVGQAEEELGVV